MIPLVSFSSAFTSSSHFTQENNTNSNIISKPAKQDNTRMPTAGQNLKALELGETRENTAHKQYLIDYEFALNMEYLSKT